LSEYVRAEIEIVIAETGHVIRDPFHRNRFVKSNSFLDAGIQRGACKDVIACVQDDHSTFRSDCGIALREIECVATGLMVV
jgi:hypothetical protein